MKNLIFFDTSFESCRAMLIQNNSILYFAEDNRKLRHSYKLLPLIDSILKKNNLKLNEIDCFSSILGPGSFTGIRISMATAKSFVYALKKKMILLNNLDIFGEIIRYINLNKIISVIYAGKDLYYSAEFIKTDNNIKKINVGLRKSEYFLNNIKNETIVVQKKHKKLFESNKFINIIPFETFNYYELVYNMINNKIINNDFSDVFCHNPVYLKKSDAEHNKKIR